MADASLSIVRDATGRSREAENPQSPLVRFGPEKPLRLDAGIDLTPFQIAYQTYGELNAERSNAVLICHALTGDQHVANVHPVTGKPGWWETMVGSGRPIDEIALGVDRPAGPRMVGNHGGVRPADRHRALFRHLSERGGRLHGHHGAVLDQSGDRRAVGPGLP